jgi:tetrahydromethanopterin S-methyltransferase subunit D
VARTPQDLVQVLAAPAAKAQAAGSRKGTARLRAVA